MLALELGRVGAAKRVAPGQEEEQQHAEGVDVDPLVDRDAEAGALADVLGLAVGLHSLLMPVPGARTFDTLPIGMATDPVIPTTDPVANRQRVGAL